jgi:hypothetical protein
MNIRAIITAERKIKAKDYILAMYPGKSFDFDRARTVDGNAGFSLWAPVAGESGKHVEYHLTPDSYDSADDEISCRINPREMD